MKYMIERGVDKEVIEVPAGHTFTSIPTACETKDGSIPVYRIEFFDSEGMSVAVFSSVTGMYPETMTPQKKTWAN